jgi:hypothetical protein
MIFLKKLGQLSQVLGRTGTGDSHKIKIININ